MQQHKRGRQVRGSGYGWRHKGKYAANALEVSGDKGEKVAISAGGNKESEQQWGRPPGLRKTLHKSTKGRMRKTVTVESRGGRPSGTEGNKSEH